MKGVEPLPFVYVVDELCGSVFVTGVPDDPQVYIHHYQMDHLSLLLSITLIA